MTRAQHRAAKLAAAERERKLKLVGHTYVFAGTGELLPFGKVWTTSDGYIVQCIRVAQNVRECGHHIGRCKVIGVA